jgi:hypothetical protein
MDVFTLKLKQNVTAICAGWLANVIAPMVPIVHIFYNVNYRLKAKKYLGYDFAFRPTRRLWVGRCSSTDISTLSQLWSVDRAYAITYFEVLILELLAHYFSSYVSNFGPGLEIMHVFVPD